MHASAKRSEIARAAGVAESTVSRALNKSPLISPETRERVRAAAEALGYFPSRQAALFAQRRTCRIGFVVRAYKAFPPFSRAYFPALLDGAVLAAEERGYLVAVVLDRTDRQPRNIAHVVKRREVDGLLLPIVPAGDERIRNLREHDVPFVLINDYRKGCFSVDGKAGPGMRKAFAHAAELGHRRVGYITGDPHYRNATDRLARFREFVNEFGMQAAVEEGDFSRTSGFMGAAKLIRRNDRPTLIMTASDRAALGVLDYCRQHGIDVPRDLSVIGYDNLDPARTVSPALTTVDNPVTRSGYVAAGLLIDVLEKRVKRKVTRWLDTDFVVRQSTGPCAQEET